MGTIKWVANSMPKTEDHHLKIMSTEEIEKASTFHQSFPMYEKTPLVELKKLAKKYGLGGIYVKDESYRFGLNAFKVLGGSYAIAKHVATGMGKDIAELPYEVFTSSAMKEAFGEATFYTATDGNHGRGVAWAASKLGQKAVVYMPKGSKEIRLQNIHKEGAQATIEEGNYDACVRMAAKAAEDTIGGVVIQDTAWEGYTEIPSWIMQGYGTMAKEAADELERQGKLPTHIFIQAGVGSLAGAVQGYFANRYQEKCPTVVVVEAEEAACLYASAKSGDGGIRIVEGEMPTIMAGLACGEPNTLAWDILKNHSSYFTACPDWVAAKGMRILGAPLAGDTPVVAGESGAVGVGLLVSLMEQEEMKPLREALGLGEDSVVLLFSTEGDTDPEQYRRILWDGAYNSEKE